MAIAMIDIIVTKERLKTEVTSDHYWYDGEKLVKLSGGRLVFKYDGQKMNASTEPLYAVQYRMGQNKNRITDWVEVNKDELKVEVMDETDKHVSVFFPDALRAAVEEALYQNRFEYEIVGWTDPDEDQDSDKKNRKKKRKRDKS